MFGILLLGIASGFILNMWYKDAYIFSLEEMLSEREAEITVLKQEKRILNEELRALRLFHKKNKEV